MVEFAAKIAKIPFLIETTSATQRERFLNNLISLRKAISVEKSLLSLLKPKTFELPFALRYTTCERMDNFSDPVQCPLYMHHYTTYPQPKDSIPADHAGIQEMPEGGFHMAICDGLGHGDPGIGKMAKSIVQKILTTPFSDETKDEAKDEREAYVNYLKNLMSERRYSFETTFLEDEIRFDFSEKATLKFANFGDCALLVLNPQGQVSYASRDRPKEHIEVQRMRTRRTNYRSE